MERALGFAPLPADLEQRWRSIGASGSPHRFPGLLGFDYLEVRQDYARARLPFRPELLQSGGAVHGGVLSALLDAVVVPAIGAAYERDTPFATVDLHVQYLGAVTGEDLLAEGWVIRRGRSIVFCEAEVCTEPAGRLVARGQLTYKVG